MAERFVLRGYTQYLPFRVLVSIQVSQYARRYGRFSTLIRFPQAWFLAKVLFAH
jgi:hypothetical protein